jgi:5-carboxymethyl-2-hydroxymuconate isomerase
MINVLVTYTDNLGPEADIASLLGKIAVRLEADYGREAMVGVCIGALRLTDFIVGDGRSDWASVTIRAGLPADRLDALRERLLQDLTGLIETHLADFYLYRSLTISIELAPTASENAVDRGSINPAPGRVF